MYFLRLFYKVVKSIHFRYKVNVCWLKTFILFHLNGVKFHTDFLARGTPIININLTGKFTIGKNFITHSGTGYNMIGRQQKCFFMVGANAELIIGDNVGISCSAIVCKERITIGNSVKVGGNVVIYDTDFHSLDHVKRNAVRENLTDVKTASVIIEDGAFIGAHSTVLKGVKIGQKSIIGAGSVVTKNVPDGEIWGGNPAKFIRKII